MQVDDTYSNIADVKKRIDESSLKLHAMTLIFFSEKFKLEISNIVISSYVDAPPGSGLGSSSTLVVAILMSLADFIEYLLQNSRQVTMLMRLKECV